MNKITLLAVFGTRPEAIKMAPLVKTLSETKGIDIKVAVTAQHRQMLDQVLSVFGIKPDFDLNIMKKNQTLFDITCNALTGLKEVLSAVKPQLVLVHGDTTTTFASSLAAFYQMIPVGHVEAGLRTGDRYSPFPEEINRRLTGAISTLHFAPTIKNKENLLKENVDPKSIYVTGNTVIDALSTTVCEGYRFKRPELSGIDFKNRRTILLTAHRRENIGKPMEDIFTAVRRLCAEFDDIQVIYPVHPNPKVLEPARRILGGHPRVMLIEPLDVLDMHNLMARSFFVMTDSGGLQEEAPAMGKPVLVLRTETERPEAVQAGTVKISGVRQEDVFRDACRLLTDDSEYSRMARAVNPYGDGRASARIVKAILHHFGLGDAPSPFLTF